MNIESVGAAWVCQGCGKCTAVCPVARTGLGYSPRRLIQKSTQQEVDAALLDRALFACLACDRCAEVCKSGIGISGLMLQLRALAFREGTTGVPAHAGIIQTLMRMMANSDVTQNRLGWIDDSLDIAERGDILYFVGCAPYFEPLFENLGAHPLRTARNAIRLLNAVGVEPVLLPDERCCGHDLLWSGDIENFQRLARRNIDQIAAAGVKTVVFSCPEGLRTFRKDYPKHIGPTGLKLYHITEFVLERGDRQLRTDQIEARVTYHDPCRLGRHLGVYDAPRELLASIPELELNEMPHSRGMATCCGGTCWTECGAAVKSLQNARLDEASATGADRLVTACPKCDIHLRCALASTENRAAPQIQNIVDLLAESAGITDCQSSETSAESTKPSERTPGRKGGGTDVK